MPDLSTFTYLNPAFYARPTEEPAQEQQPAVVPETPALPQPNYYEDLQRAPRRAAAPRRTMDQYEQLGSLLTGMPSQSGGNQMLRGPNDDSLNLGETGSLTGGFNKDWLSQALEAGSANGAKIGGMMSGGGGGGGGKKSGGSMSGPQGGWGDSGGMPSGVGEGATGFA